MVKRIAASVVHKPKSRVPLYSVVQFKFLVHRWRNLLENLDRPERPDISCSWASRVESCGREFVSVSSGGVDHALTIHIPRVDGAQKLLLLELVEHGKMGIGKSGCDIVREFRSVCKVKKSILGPSPRDDEIP